MPLLLNKNVLFSNTPNWPLEGEFINWVTNLSIVSILSKGLHAFMFT